MPDTLTRSPTHQRPEPPAAPPAAPELHVHDALPAATRLDEFEIIRVLGAGGFGIVYLALDHVLLRYVAIKEYMPAALAGRSQGEAVAVRSPGHAPTYAVGLESFFNEARMLASFDHPSLVKVHRFWKANGTAYMAMQYYPGRTLREVRGELGGPPDEGWLRAIVDPLLGALEVLHGEDIYHRDIAPDNILLLPDGRPVLLDFGSARRVIGDRTQSLTAILKPNFAPVEQYADEPGMRQGPWTDLYALGATVHFVLTGQVPVPAVLRAVRDTMVAVSDPSSGPYPGIGAAFLATIDWSLALAPEDRPQSVATLRRGLDGEIRPPAPSVRLKPVVHAAASVDLMTLPAQADAYAPTQVTNPAAPAPAAAATVSAAADLPPTIRVDRPSRSAAAPASDAPPGPSQRRRVVVATLAGLVIASAALAGAARWLSNSTGAAPDVPVAAAAASAAALPASATATVAEPTAPAASSPSIVTAAAEPPAPASAAVASAASAPRREPPRPAAAKAAAEARAKAPLPAVVATNPDDAAKARPPVLDKPATSAAPKSPKELCGDLNFVALALCVSRQCEAPALQSHPQCIEARRYDEQRRRRMEQ